MNDFYNAPSVPTRNTLARAEQIQQELAGVAAGFDKLPTEAQIKNATASYAVTTGTGTAYLVTPPYPQASYVNGGDLVIKFHASNTGAATINVMGINGLLLGVKPLLRADGTELEAGDIIAGMIQNLRYDGSAWRIVSIIIRSVFTGTLPSQTGNAGKVLLTDGTAPYWGGVQAATETVAGIVELTTQAEFDTGTDTARATTTAVTAHGAGRKGTDIASASTITLPTVGTYHSVTGTTTITALSTRRAGAVVTLSFTGSLTLTHNATSLILPGQANIVTGAGDVAVFVSEGSGNWRCVNFSRANGAASATLLPRSARTSNTILAATDRNTLIDITSGTFTQTFTAAATLGTGWWCYIRNSGTGDITLDPNGSETIDGSTSYIMYPGETRMVQCDGSAFYTIVVAPYSRTFTSSGTYTKPPGYKYHYLDSQAPGGGGGSGARGSIRSEAGGGGGGGRIRVNIPDAEMPTSPATVTIGAAGTGGAGITTNDTDGNNGTSGGTNSFGGLFPVSGGVRGEGGDYDAAAATEKNAGNGGLPSGTKAALYEGSGTPYQGRGSWYTGGFRYAAEPGSENIGGGGGVNGVGGGSVAAGCGGGGPNAAGGSRGANTGGGAAAGANGTDYQGGGGGTGTPGNGGNGGLGSGGGAGQGNNNTGTTGKGGDGGAGRTIISGVI